MLRLRRPILRFQPFGQHTDDWCNDSIDQRQQDLLVCRSTLGQLAHNLIHVTTHRAGVHRIRLDAAATQIGEYLIGAGANASRVRAGWIVIYKLDANGKLIRHGYAPVVGQQRLIGADGVTIAEEKDTTIVADDDG
jgi:hypothetical protein